LKGLSAAGGGGVARQLGCAVEDLEFGDGIGARRAGAAAGHEDADVPGGDGGEGIALGSAKPHHAGGGGVEPVVRRILVRGPLIVSGGVPILNRKGGSVRGAPNEGDGVHGLVAS